LRSRKASGKSHVEAIGLMNEIDRALPVVEPAPGLRDDVATRAEQRADLVPVDVRKPAVLAKVEPKPASASFANGGEIGSDVTARKDRQAVPSARLISESVG
jgi:hypothetical protein